MHIKSKIMTTTDAKCKLNAIYEELLETGRVNNKRAFATLLGVNYNALTQAMNGVERYLTNSLLSKATSALNNNSSNINFDIKNLGELSEDEKREIVDAIERDFPITMQSQMVSLVPTIPYKAYKEIGVDLQEYIRSQSPDLHMSPAIAQFAKTDCHYFVGSDAMLPHLHQSDVLALKRMPEQAQVINGEIYVVNSRYNGLIARFVYDDGDHLILRASDEQRRYTPMRLPKKDIFGLYRVLGLVRTNI